MKKRALSLLLALVMVIGLLPVTARAEELDNGLEYEVYEDHVEITWYYGDATEVVIPEEIEGLPVTVIGSVAFNACPNLIRVTIPDTVTRIEDAAFLGCQSLSSISIPASVTYIGQEAFFQCFVLTGIHVDENNPCYSSDERGVLFDKEKTLLIQAPGGIEGSYAIPDGVTVIGDTAFGSCEALTSISIPEGVTDIGYWAFYGCTNLSDISLPDSVTHIGVEAFAWCFSLTSISIPVGVTSISDGTFLCCFSLDSVSMPESVTSIGVEAFRDCNGLTSISIPERVTEIGSAAFHGCGKLTGIHVDANNPNYSNDDRGVLFDKEKTLLIQAPGAIKNFYAIPDSVTQIGDCAFSSCYWLSGVSIPEGVTYIGEEAFSYCTLLTTMEIPESVTHIGASAFNSCEGLTSVRIPKNVTYIGKYAFFECYALTGIHVDEDNLHYSSDDRGVLFDKEKTHLIQAPCAITGSYAIPDGVVTIGDEAFDSCYYLTGVSLPDGVRKLGTFAFYDCKKLTSIKIPGSVTHLDYGAIAFCDSLTAICFEGSAPMIDYSIFGNDNVTAYYPASDPTWTADVMQNSGEDITWIGYNPEGSFYDVQMNSWYEEPVAWAVEKGITNGATNETFDPNGECLRAQVVTFLWRTAGCPEPKTTQNPFVDVKPSDFYYKAVLWAVENNITNGADATHFNPFGICNRAQVVTFLYRAQTDPQIGDSKGSFSDVSDNAWYSEPIEWAASNGITNGISATEFGIVNPCNRAQVVTFLHRTYT